MRGRVLLIDDDEDLRGLLALKLQDLEFAVTAAESAEEGLRLLSEGEFDVVLSDYELPGLTGTEFCGKAAHLRPDVPVIILTSHDDLAVAVEAIRAGASDFLTKPIEIELVRAALDRATENRTLRREVERLRRDPVRGDRFPEIVGESRAMQPVFRLLEQVAEVDISVLITGETGTGKEVIARALHSHSPRRDGPFLAVNCAAVPEQLLESELFGHIKGAFTDANEDRKGIFLQADGGTLFLDEIGDMPLGLQSKLLRALQERRVRPVGSETDRPFDVRILAATNQGLAEAIEAGRFRRDLYYRLNVIEIDLPPLRDRGQDILLLAQHFLAAAAARLERPLPTISPEAAGHLLRAPWSGNIRELQNCMERAVVVATGPELRVLDLPEALRQLPEAPAAARDADAPLETLAQLEARHITRVLAAMKGNKVKASKTLGIDRTTLYRKLERYGIS